MPQDALLAMNTAELDAVNSTESMIGILQQWGMESSELITIIDKLNYTADNNAVTTQDLVDALLKSSSMAKTANLSFNDTVGVLTAMKEASGAAGKEVGNAFKSILSYIQRPMSLEWFDANGIQVYADESKNALLPMMQILKNMSESWKKFSSSQQDSLMSQMDAAGLFTEEMAEVAGATEDYTAYVDAAAAATNTLNTEEARSQANMAAGTYRRNYYVSLMENFSKATKVSSEMLNAEGHSAAENSKYMETLEAKYQQLIASLQQLAVEAGNAGLMDLAKGAVDAASSVTQLIGKANGLIPILQIVLGLLIAIKATKISQSITNLGNHLSKTINSMSQVVKSMTSMGQSTMTASTAITGLTGWLGVVVTAIGAVSLAINNHNQHMAELRQNAINSAEELNTSIDALETYKTRVEELRRSLDSGNLSQEEAANARKELLSIQSELIEQYGAEASSIDLVTGNLRRQITTINELEIAQAQQWKQENQKAVSAAEKFFSEKKNYSS